MLNDYNCFCDMNISFTSYRTNIQGQYEDNKKAEIPSKKGANDHKLMLLLKVSISMK